MHPTFIHQRVCVTFLGMSAAEWNSAAQQINIGWKPIDSNSIDRVCTCLSRRFQTAAGKRCAHPKL
jgi:hypothetical protein